MRVTVRAALRFKHRAGLEKGLTAFDGGTDPASRGSGFWRVIGPFAVSDHTFEIEPDRSYDEAFLAMAREAVEGEIELRVGDRPRAHERIFRNETLGWMKTPVDDRDDDAFGSDVARLLLEWQPLIDKAKSNAAVKARKEARKSALSAAGSLVVNVGATPTHVVVLPDESFVVAAGSKLFFVAATGEITSTTECARADRDPFGAGITSMVALADGRVVACQEHASEARIAERGESRAAPLRAEALETHDVKGCVDGAASFYLKTRHSVLVFDRATTTLVRELRPWGHTQTVRHLVPWRDGLVVSNGTSAVAFDERGHACFAMPGDDVYVVGSHLLALADRKGLVVDERGARLHELDTGKVGHGPPPDSRAAVAIAADQLHLATRWPSAAASWNLTTGVRRWQSASGHAALPGGCVATRAIVATWAPPPFVREQDTRIAIFDRARGAMLAMLDPKAPVIDVIALGDDALAAVVAGRAQGIKVFVWRNVATSPRSEVLLGHTGRVLGIRRLGEGRLISWAADKTARIWTWA